MKKRIISLSLVLMLLLFSFAGCATKKDFMPSAENLAKDATYTAQIKEKKEISKKFSMTNDKKEVVVTFPREVEINTILLHEKTDAVTAFEIWTKIDNKMELIYKQDEIDGTRYCYLDNIKVTELTLIASSQDGKFNIDKFEAYNIVREQKDFRITTYLSVGEFLANNIDSEGLKHCTDIILFGTSTYNDLGELTIDRENVDKAIEKIKEVRGEEMPKILVNFVLNSGLKNDKEMSGEKFFAFLQKIALQTNGEKLINNLVEFAKEKNLSGIAFDYEFPYTLDDYSVYGNFLVNLKKAMPDKLISIAVATWGLHFSKQAIAAVDTFEIMAYDLMDEQGNHSGWSNCCVNAINYMEKQGIPKSKMNLGVPFYSRPVDYGAYWGGWSSECNKMSKFSNYVADEFISQESDGKNFLVKGRWYNGVNMIQDKTAYAFDRGLGGMMIWHYNCDVPYDSDKSLLRAMNNIFDK